MSTITIMLTRRRWNPISWLIRYGMPRSRFALALSSHAIVFDGDICYEATMLHGVREVPRQVAMAGQHAVYEKRFSVPNRAAGIAWARAQVCTYQPNPPKWLPKWLRSPLAVVLKLARNNYDFKGAFGIAFAPGRKWQEDDCWFCFEFAAGVLRAAGRDVFADLSHVGETALIAINPDY